MAWNGSDGARRIEQPKRRDGLTKGIVAGVVVALGGLAALVFLLTNTNPRHIGGEPDTSRRIKDAQPAIANQAKDVGNAKGQAPANGQDTAEVAEQLTPEEIEAIERAKDPLYDRHHIVAKKPLLEEPVEQLMLSVFETELGDMPPMLPAIPKIDQKKLDKIVGMMTETKEDDSDEAKIAKGTINAVKIELKKYLDEGGTVENFLNYYVNELDSAFNERNLCKQLQMKSMKTDDPEVAREYFHKLNERLINKGIKPLTLTNRQKQYLGITE